MQRSTVRLVLSITRRHQRVSSEAVSRFSVNRPLPAISRRWRSGAANNKAWKEDGPEHGRKHEIYKTAEGKDSYDWRGIAVPVALVSLAAILIYIVNESGARFPSKTGSESNAHNLNSILPLDNLQAPWHNTTISNLQEAREEFVDLLGDNGVNDIHGELLAHSSTEWSPALKSTDHPALIVYPASTEDVSKIVKICHRRRIPITGFSGGTSLEGALAATFGGICVDFKMMDKILALHKRDMDVVVQPAVGWEALNVELAKDDLFFPPDPGPGAQIGGMVGTGCSGTNAYRYGTMKDWVISLTVVLADGTIIKTRHRPRKSTAGYDLGRLFVGSGGTLGLVTEAVLKITAKPKNVQVAVAAFPSSHNAVETVVKLVQHGVMVAAVEMLDAVTMKAINQSGFANREWSETPTLFFKFSGTSQGVQEDIALVKKWAKETGCTNFETSQNPTEIEALWSARKTALWSLLAMKRDSNDKFLSADVAVPLSRLADIIEETKEKIEESGLLGSTLGHVGDGTQPPNLVRQSLTRVGNFHTTVLYGEKDRQIAEGIIKTVQKRGIEMEGTVTGEHGIGLTFRDALNSELGDDTLAAMRTVSHPTIFPLRII